MRDYRTALSQSKHYFNAPIPLFLHLCSLNITRAQENIFWLHWGEGQMHGDWKSAIPIKTVADRLKLSVSTVKRAYADLEALGLIRRHRQGRSLSDPMRMAVTITEVTIPQDVAEVLMEAPDRAKKKVTHEKPSEEQEDTMAAMQKEPSSAPKPLDPRRAGLKYEAIHDEDESNMPVSSRWFNEQRMLSAELEMREDEPVMPSSTDVTNSLESVDATLISKSKGPSPKYLQFFSQRRRKIHPGLAFKLLRAIRHEQKDDQRAKACWHQMLWSLEYGLYAEDPVRKAYNMMMKLLRKKIWSKPWAMPEAWKWSAA